MRNFLLLFLVLFISGACTSSISNRERVRLDGDLGGEDRFARRDNPPKNVCDSFSKCRVACSEIYKNHPEEINRCLQLDVKEVEDIHYIAPIFKNASRLDLKYISAQEFALFMSVGTRTLNKYIYGYTIPEARRFLSWVAEERDIAHVLFALGPEEYKNIFLTLISSVSPLTVENALHWNLVHGSNFYTVSNENNNDYAVYMAHTTIEDELCDFDYEYALFNLSDFNETCVLRVYCHEDEGHYIHARDFGFISSVIERDKIFDFIQEEDAYYGLGINSDELTTEICERVCTNQSCS